MEDMDRPTFGHMKIEDHIDSDQEEVVEMLEEIDTTVDETLTELEDEIGSYDSLRAIDATELTDEEIDTAIEILNPLDEEFYTWWDEVTSVVGKSVENPIVIILANLGDELNNCLRSLIDVEEIRALVEMIETDVCMNCGSSGLSSEFTTVSDTEVRLITCSSCDMECPIPLSRLEPYDLD